jgi:hypothetical protein
MPEDVSPRCRCTPAEIALGHRHRCPEGPPVYVAVGRWVGRNHPDLVAEYHSEMAARTEQTGQEAPTSERGC